MNDFCSSRPAEAVGVNAKQVKSVSSRVNLGSMVVLPFLNRIGILSTPGGTKVSKPTGEYETAHIAFARGQQRVGLIKLDGLDAIRMFRTSQYPPPAHARRSHR